MLRSTIRTIVTGKASIGLATLALLGGGAALAAPDGTPAEEVLAAVSTPVLDTVPPDVSPVEPNTPATAPALDEVPEALEDDVPVELASDGALYPPAAETTDEEDDGPGWALGREAETALGSQQDRVEAFCVAKTLEAEEAGTPDEGIPPFCMTEDGDVPPNQFGRTIADAARDGDRPIGPPAWAGRDGDRDRSDDGSTEVEPSGPPADTDRPEGAGRPEGVPPGPPAHANAGGRGNG